MIKNCFNYVGSKDRIFPLIDENLDKTKKNFIDLFCGSGVVGVNELPNYKNIVLNDACWQMTETLKFFRDNSYEHVISEIEKVINKYKLSKTNKEGYLSLREDYNTESYHKLTFSPAKFYCLVTHSFNYNIHINSSGKFSVPSGNNRCYFNNLLRTKLESFCWELNENKNKVSIKTENFEKLISQAERIIPKSMFYIDPPYYASDSSYERIYYLGKWDEPKERLLYRTLDFIHENGGSFLLSNVLDNNGVTNVILSEWCSKYNVIEISSDYSNCNYQRKNKGKTKEILVRNY